MNTCMKVYNHVCHGFGSKGMCIKVGGLKVHGEVLKKRWTTCLTHQGSRMMEVPLVEALMERFGILTCVFEDSLLMVPVMECLVLV
jgi:hypothetical protein